MFNKNHLFKKVWIFVAIPILLFPSMVLHAEISGTELLNLLREKDQISNTAGYIVSFVMVRNAKMFDPDQGLVFMNCQVTWTKESFAMKITYHYEHPPVFAPIGTRNYKAFDYDREGNLIVWRSLENYVVFAPDRNDKVEKIKAFFVDPNGILVDKGGTQTILQRFPAGNRDSIYEFDQFQLAAGRGFSRHLGNVTSVKTLTSGLMKTTSQGSFGGPSLQGTWELAVDPNSDYLAREAVFTIEGMDRPSQVTTSSSVVAKDEIRLARSGTYKYSNILELSIEVTDISKVVGENKLYNEVLSHLNSPLPSGSEIMDHRGEKPVVTTVE